MIYFKVTQTAPDHTGQMDIVENIVSQFDLQEHLINSKGVVNVEKVERIPFEIYFFVYRREGLKIYKTAFYNKKDADQFEKFCIDNKNIYKKYILQDKL